jgi:hypothetical protein
MIGHRPKRILKPHKAAVMTSRAVSKNRRLPRLDAKGLKSHLCTGAASDNMRAYPTKRQQQAKGHDGGAARLFVTCPIHSARDTAMLLDDFVSTSIAPRTWKAKTIGGTLAYRIALSYDLTLKVTGQWA